MNRPVWVLLGMLFSDHVHGITKKAYAIPNHHQVGLLNDFAEGRSISIAQAADDCFGTIRAGLKVGSAEEGNQRTFRLGSNGVVLNRCGPGAPIRQGPRNRVVDHFRLHVDYNRLGRGPSRITEVGFYPVSENSVFPRVKLAGEDVGPQLLFRSFLSDADLFGSGSRVLLGIAYRPLSFGPASYRLARGSSVCTLGDQIAAPSLSQGSECLVYRYYQTRDSNNGQERSSYRPAGCPAGFMRCFFSSESRAPLSAQIGSVVVLGTIASIGIFVG